MRLIEIPVHDNPVVTSRSLDPNHISNSSITVLEEEKQLNQLIQKLKELYIRFDINPKFYLTEDYKFLLNVISSGLRHLYAKVPEIVTEWNELLSDEKLPSEKLVKDTIDTLIENLQEEISERQSDSARMSSRVDRETSSLNEAIELLLESKQDNLAPGDNISITNNVISAVDTIYDDTEVRGLINSLDSEINSISSSLSSHTSNTDIHVTTADKTKWNSAEPNVLSNWTESNTSSDAYILNKPTKLSDFTDDLGSSPTHTHSLYLTQHLDISGKQDVLTAGTGIDITNNVISNTQTSAEWGNITGTLSELSDLNTILEAKANTSDLATVATTGSYDDLTNKPTIPVVPTNISSFTNDSGYLTTETDPTVPNWAKEPNKPSYTAQEVGALPDSTVIPSKTSQLTNDSGFLTSHLNISGKEDKSNKVTSISSNSTDTQYPSAKCVYNEFATTVTSEEVLTVNDIIVYAESKIPVIDKTSDSSASFFIDPNKMYMFGTRTTLTINLLPGESGIVNEYMFQFTSGSIATTLNVPSSVVWLKEPDVQTGKKYAVSIENNLGIIGEWNNE